MRFMIKFFMMRLMRFMIKFFMMRLMKFLMKLMKFLMRRCMRLTILNIEID
jgi:hypothetical protein